MRLNALENAEKRSTNRRTIIERLPSVSASFLVLVACSPNYFEKGGLTHLKITFQNNPTVIGERFEIHECIEIETYIRITSFNREVYSYSGVPLECPFVSNLTDLFWYALRITYSRELALKEYLDAEHIENFIPMRYEYIVKDERRIRKLVPAVHNLVFVRSSRVCIDHIKESVGSSLPVRYIMDREHHQPIIVPEVQMRSFMAVAGSYEQQLVYLEPASLAFRKGDRVRVVGGLFEGVEGEFIRVKNDRRVVVSIHGVMAVATTFIHPSLIEPID